jgi:hypothetical protein
MAEATQGLTCVSFHCDLSKADTVWLDDKSHEYTQERQAVGKSRQD